MNLAALSSVLQDLALLPALARERNAPAAYDRAAPRYERFHRRWLRRGGVEAMAALRGCLAAELRPGMRVLDAGCGPGTLARWVAGAEPTARLTLLDAAPGMLARATAAVPEADWALGDVTALPFPDGRFDVVLSTWVLETLPDADATARAVSELHRVAAPGGVLCLCICTVPDAWNVRLRTHIPGLVMARCFHGRALPPAFPPLSILTGAGNAGRDAPRIRRLRDHLGLSTFLCIRTGARTGVRSAERQDGFEAGLESA